jgi:hypothetical protein
MKKNASKKDDTEKLSIMRKRMSMAVSAYSDSRESELDDLRFTAGSPDNQWQWPQDVISTRGTADGASVGARPCITINKLPQHIKQVTNDQRQNRPSGKIIPANEFADVEVAEILDGIVRHIEYISDADVAYDTACENQVTFGEGYFRLLTEYTGPDSFDQDIRIGRIRNSFSVFMDPTIQDPCGSDAEWCFITEDILKEEYERLYPDAQPISSLDDAGVGDDGLGAWLTEDTVRIAEYFYIEHTAKTLNMYQGGATASEGSEEAVQMESVGYTAVKTRKIDVKSVKWCKTNGFEILESQDWAGSWIPVIRVVGNEFEVEGKMHLSGIVRNAKDAQRMYNYWVSQEAEMLALAPKAPFIGYGGQFEGYENQWKTANTTNWPYLEVNTDVMDANGSPLPLPQRAPPPLAQAGLIQAKMGAADDIKTVTGQYDASLGAAGNEKSGKAIMARERQTDTGTYHYVDNLSRAIRYCTRQIVDLIPKIYDTQRIARIVGIDGEIDNAEINPEQQEAVREIQDEQGAIKKIYNPGIGKYDVTVTTGPSYMTKRQEALEGMATLLQGNPNLWATAGDLFIKHMDWPGAEEMAERFQKTMDPKIFAESEGDPAMAAAQQQMQQMQQQMEQMQQMLQNVDKSIEMQEIEIKKREVAVKEFDAETKRVKDLGAVMTADQIHDIVQGSIDGMVSSGQLMRPEPLEQPMQQPPMQPEQQMPMGMDQPMDMGALATQPEQQF